MSSLFIVMPAYNEELNIEKAVRSWYPVLSGKDSGSRLVIADSGSKDSTHEILTHLKEEFPLLEIISDTHPGHGPKLIAMYKYAIECGADYIFQTDSDGQTDPQEFDEFWAALKDYDAVIGYRPIRGDGKARAFVEKIVCILLKLYFHVNVPDANAPFRLMKSSLVAKYITRFDKEYNLPNIMLTTFFAFYKENVTFKPVSFRPRVKGKSSINIANIIKVGSRALLDFSVFHESM